MLTEEQPDVFGPVSIEKISVVGRQVKDTSAVSITTVTFENHRYATRLIFIQSTKLHALPVQHLNMQHTMNIMRNSNPTQLNSNGARRKRGSNNGGGSIQRPSPLPIQQNRKSIIKMLTDCTQYKYFNSRSEYHLETRDQGKSAAISSLESLRCYYNESFFIMIFLLDIYITCSLRWTCIYY